jgi:hypothetical protein
VGRSQSRAGLRNAKLKWLAAWRDQVRKGKEADNGVEGDRSRLRRWVCAGPVQVTGLEVRDETGRVQVRPYRQAEVEAQTPSDGDI